MADQSLYYPGSIDSHTHTMLLALKDLDYQTVLAEAQNGALGRLVDVGVEPSDVEGRLATLGAYSILAFTAGLHPTAVTPESVSGELDLLAQLLAGEHSRRIVAVGEIGLDFYWSTDHRDLQLEVLERQCRLAAEHRLPVILHNRDSEEAMLDLLVRLRPSGIMHCFSQGADYCRSCLDAGLHISFGGNLTYGKSSDIREAAALVPDDRLLVETDAPFLSPQVVRGEANHPGHLGFTIEALAEVRGSSPVQIADITARNARELFRLD